MRPLRHAYPYGENLRSVEQKDGGSLRQGDEKAVDRAKENGYNGGKEPKE